jgi:hypothetical protein
MSTIAVAILDQKPVEVKIGFCMLARAYLLGETALKSGFPSDLIPKRWQ